VSNKPGNSLESFVMWNYNLIVDDDDTANESLRIAEILGTATRRRPQITNEEFAPILVLFEPYRDRVEDLLNGHDDNEASWRDFAGYAFDFIPDEVYTQGAEIIEALTKAAS
jgi:hypothetical protein